MPTDFKRLVLNSWAGKSLGAILGMLLCEKGLPDGLIGRVSSVQRDSRLDTLENELLYVLLLNCIHRNLFGKMPRDDNYTIDVAYDDVSGEDRHSAAANGQVHVDGMVGDQVSGSSANLASTISLPLQELLITSKTITMPIKQNCRKRLLCKLGLIPGDLNEMPHVSQRCRLTNGKRPP